jgi:hypothetical protein
MRQHSSCTPWRECCRFLCGELSKQAAFPLIFVSGRFCLEWLYRLTYTAELMPLTETLKKGMLRAYTNTRNGSIARFTVPLDGTKRMCYTEQVGTRPTTRDI